MYSNFRTAITNAIIHSRPPSYRSHSSDQETSAPAEATHRSPTDAAPAHSPDRVVMQQPTTATAEVLSSLRRPDHLVNVVSVNSPPSSVAVTSSAAPVSVADPTGSSAKSTPVKTAVMMTADDLIPPPLKSGGSSKKDSVSGRKNNKKGSERHNLVTIVQTSRTDPVENDSSTVASSAAEESVIVTVSGSVDSQQSLRASPGEVEILAHL